MQNQNQPTPSCSLSKPKFDLGSSFYYEQFNTACLSEFSYYIESEGEAAVIDPIREISHYVDLAKSRNAKIKYVFETHFHADFVSGHVDLAKATGAKIVYGPQATAEFELYSAKDEEELPLGKVAVKVLHTPGHTLESSCYLLLDENKTPKCIFTGDTIFLGAVGRPDLAVKSDLTKEDLAKLLYDSIQNKILPLRDDIVVFPSHGAGSACGKGISKGSFSTIGEQKATNYALQPMTKEEFVTIISTDIPTPPKYFFHDAAMNKKNYDNIDDIIKRSLAPLSVQQAQELVTQNHIILDCRENSKILETGIVPGSVAISLTMPFAVWVGTLLNPLDNFVIVCESGKEEEAIIRLARVGFENCKGYVQGGAEEWVKQTGKPLDKVCSHEVKEHLDEVSKKPNIKVLDVRNPPEWEGGVYGGSIRISLSQLESEAKELDKKTPIHILCKSGMRAAIAYSILRRLGFEDLGLIKGGADKLGEHGFKFQEFKK